MKRFTETEKWRDPWFQALSPIEKCLFMYLTDNCNNAGFYEENPRCACFFLGIREEEYEGALKGLSRGIKGASGWLWVRRFLRHQKHEPLNTANPAHRQIVCLVSEQVERFGKLPEFQDFLAPIKPLLAPNKGLPSPIGKGIGKGIGKKRESPEREKIAEEIYNCYPRKVAKGVAITAILNAIDRGTSPIVLLERTKAFSNARNGDVDFCPNPATWFNQERFNDDPSTWKESNKVQNKPKESAPTGAAYRVYDAYGPPT